MDQAVAYGPQLDFPLGGRIERLVARWAHETPDATALRWHGRDISYRDLVADAGAVAAALADRGVTAGDFVTVRMARSPQQVAVLLGVLMTGAAYAGIATEWPDVRYQQILDATGARVAVVEGAVARPLEVEAAALLGSGSAAVPELPAGVDGHSPAIVFFSSGTSGSPHTIVTPHLGSVRVSMDPALRFGRHTRLFHVSPLGWDVPSMELWAPLMNGGTCHLFDGLHPTSTDIRAAIADGANVMFLTTGLLNAVVDEDIDCLVGMEHVITGGERASASHVDRMLAHLPELTLTNGYGPAECTIFASLADLVPRTDDGEYPIGVPVANTGVHVLDDDHVPVPAGVRGEIALSGDGLALGYLGDPDATAAKFVTLAPEHGGERVYLTGDVGMLDAAGVAHYIDRRDRQFKLKGMRIDPFEVETLICRHPDVTRAALVALPVDDVAKRSAVGFYVGATTPDALRDHLMDLVPAGIVPLRFQQLDALPILLNGKLDRRRLGELATAAPARASTSAPAVPAADVGSAGELAVAIAAAAAELLDVPVTVDSDLFASGADSLTVIRIVNRLGAGLSPKAVFTHRTPRRIAADTLAATPEKAPARAGRSPFRIHGLPTTQYRMWHLGRTGDGGDVNDANLFRLTGAVDVPALSAAFDAVVARHDALRTLLIEQDVKTVVAQVVDPAELGSALDTSGRLSLSDVFDRPFDLAREIPFRAALIDDDLAVCVHHAAFDGWSEELFFRELSNAYRGSLPAEPVLGFQEAALAQQRLWEDEGYDADFWLDHLRDVPELPLHTKTVTGPGPLAEVPVRLDLIDRQRLAELCAPTGTTVGAVYLAAWIAALRDASGAADFAVGMPVAGRVIQEAADVIGCFASSAVLRFDAGVGRGRPLIEHAATMLRRAVTDQFVPLERALHELRPEPTGRNPFCQAGFVLQNNAEVELSLPGVVVDRVRLPQRTSLFELAIELWPSTPADSHVWYRTDLFPADLAKELADGWLRHMGTLAPALEQGSAG